MAYQAPSVQDFMALLNSANSTSFVAGDFDFSTPKVIAGTWQEAATNKNTAVRVVGKAGGKYQGKVDILYDRLKLDDLVHVKGWRALADTPASAHALIAPISYFTGIQLTVDDIEDNPVVDNGDGSFTATITAKAGSYGWTGSVPLSIKQGGVSLITSITQPLLPGIDYPTENDTDTFALVYMYPHDFTQYHDALEAISEGVLSDANSAMLVDAFKVVDTGPNKSSWNNNPVGVIWSLAGATVTYNGLNGADLPTNPAYKYVMGLKLRTDVTTPSGQFYIHYNDPFVLDDFS